MKKLLQKIYGVDFSQVKSAEEFRDVFFARKLKLVDLKEIHNFLSAQSFSVNGQEIPAVLHLKAIPKNNFINKILSFVIPAQAGILSPENNKDTRLRGYDKLFCGNSIKSSVNSSGSPFIILAQLHGNEPAGLAGVVLTMALFEAKMLAKDVLCVIGNPLAAHQYFSAWEADKNARQETRDCYRCGLSETGELLPDGNRIPVDFLTRTEVTPHIKRARELFALAGIAFGTLDIHSARGNMTCITEHLRDEHLKYSPIRAVLTDLSEAIAANASAIVSVQTLKTIVEKLPNIKCQTGIEAGKHEDEKSPIMAAEFTLATIYNLGITPVKPLRVHDDGKFTRYSVQPRITYADLQVEGELQADDVVYMAREIDGKIEEYQYDEMEAINANQVVAIAKPSGAIFRAKTDFAGVFFSKSAVLYDKDPAVGPWPVAVEKLSSIKFCYPCVVSEIQLSF